MTAKAGPPKKRAPPQEARTESPEKKTSRLVVMSFLMKGMKVIKSYKTSDNRCLENGLRRASPVVGTTLNCGTTESSGQKFGVKQSLAVWRSMFVRVCV